MADLISLHFAVIVICLILNSFPKMSFFETERSDTEPPDYQPVKPHRLIIKE